MVHSGHEASAVDYNFGSIKGFLTTAKKYMFTSMYPDEGATEAAERVEGLSTLVRWCRFRLPVVDDVVQRAATVSGD